MRLEQKNRQKVAKGRVYNKETTAKAPVVEKN